MSLSSDYAANIIDLSDKYPPGGIYMLDTNALVYGIGYDFMIDDDLAPNNSNSESLRNKYDNFLTNISKNDEYAFYTSVQRDELRTVCQSSVSFKKAKSLGGIYRRKKWGEVYKEFPELVQESKNVYDRLMEIIETSDYIQDLPIYNIEEVDALQKYLLDNYAVETNDAKIIAASLSAGNLNLVSEEWSWVRIPGINLYTGNQKSITNKTNPNTLITDSDMMKSYGHILKKKDKE